MQHDAQGSLVVRLGVDLLDHPYRSPATGKVFQVGFGNTADDVSGFQLGLVNVAENLYGVQIGLMNIIESKTTFSFLQDRELVLTSASYCCRGRDVGDACARSHAILSRMGPRKGGRWGVSVASLTSGAQLR